jgi:HAD superfamily hydrolase (TIGR01450 family)
VPGTNGQRIADRYDGWLLDLDGVVYVGDQALPGAPETIGALRDRGDPVVFVTNDPRSARDEFAAKLTRLGVPSSRDDVLTSGSATAAYLERHGRAGRTVFVIGSDALRQEMEAIGCRPLDGEAGKDAELVVIGGWADLTYWHIAYGSIAVRRGAELYATNRDATFPMPDGPWPATGALVAAVEVGAGCRAIAIGKPEPHMFEVVKDRHPERRLAVVGDRLDADILGAKRAGLGAVLVRRDGSDPGTADVEPDYVVDGLHRILDRGGR